MSTIPLAQAQTIIQGTFEKAAAIGCNPLTVAVLDAGGRMVPAPGGVLTLAPDSGDIIGAVGISGDVSGNDEAAAIAGFEAAGLKAVPGGE